MNKLIFLITSAFFCNYAYATQKNSTIDSFDLICDTVYETGYVLGKDRISPSYITWDKNKKSLIIKSEQINEFHNALNKSHYDIYTSKTDLDEYQQRGHITFKSKNYGSKWKQEDLSHYVSFEVQLNKSTKRAFVKLTDFSQDQGVISLVTTSHITCDMR